ncbi:MAG: signal peptide peptidase SppA [Deltaproteobacteria bacterium]|nr:signal peptide peptidase SppA [Deltaproteobacteria bacterium]
MPDLRTSSPARFIVFLTGLALFAFLSVYLLTSFFGRDRESSVSLGGDKIGVVEIKGVILNSEHILKTLNRYVDDRNVKGILLRIDSPGGAVAPSQEIYDEIRKIHKEGKKKVVASFGNVAASGAYYVASAADRIVANPGSLTGSIGVIMEMTNIRELLDKIGIDSYVIKSGEFKDIGNMTRPMTEREHRLIQGVINDIYMQFVEDVASGRKMDVAKVKKIADGSIFSGRQALGLGLVDKLGSFQDAVDLLAGMSGIRGKPRLIYERKAGPSWLDYVAKGTLRKVFQLVKGEAFNGIFYLMQ